MRVAVLGAGGFVGYAFVREALRRGMTPVACWGSPGSLVLLARHHLELRSTTDLRLDDVDVVVNCAHPFTERAGRSPVAQADRLQETLLRCGRPVIHLSTISVYEPFAHPRPSEDLACAPPAGDEYARTKLRLDRALGEAGALILRPTIVYGPFGRFWTDAFLEAFRAGEVAVPDPGGRVQPVYVEDLARLMAEACERFRPGLLNVGGPEEMAWREYFQFWAGIAGGRLRETSPTTGARRQESELVALVRYLVDAPPLRRLGRPFIQRVPAGLRARVRRLLGRPDRPRLVPVAPLDPPASPPPELPRDLRGLVASGYFSQDRLVDLGRLAREFPDLRLTRLAGTRPRMRQYFEFRFTDALPR